MQILTWMYRYLLQIFSLSLSFDFSHTISFFQLYGLPSGSSGKESSCSVGDMRLIPGLGRCPEGGNATPPVFLSGKSHEQRSLEGYK